MKPHYLELLERLIAAPDDKVRSEILARNKAERAHLRRQWPTMPPFYHGPRTELTELRPGICTWLKSTAISTATIVRRWATIF
jgi:hypothetical protein